MEPTTEPIFRFAPSPNGHLHLGHAYSALYTAHWAAKLGGKFLLRIEDIDTARCKPEFVKSQIDDLHWLGLNWPEPVIHQSNRFESYKAAAQRLRDMDLLYPCFCSRVEIKTASTGTDPDGAPLYPGTCKHLSKTEISQRLANNEPVQWRLNIDEALRRTGILTFTNVQPTPLDRPQIRYAKPERWGDVVLVRKDTPTSYHLSVIVDDAHQNITHVTRGKDLEAATDIHILLQFLLGLPQPLYTHHKLIKDDADIKLSKSKSAQTLKDMREAGWTADAVRTRLGF